MRRRREPPRRVELPRDGLRDRYTTVVLRGHLLLVYSEQRWSRLWGSNPPRFVWRTDLSPEQPAWWCRAAPIFEPTWATELRPLILRVGWVGFEPTSRLGKNQLQSYFATNPRRASSRGPGRIRTDVRLGKNQLQSGFATDPKSFDRSDPRRERGERKTRPARTLEVRARVSTRGRHLRSGRRLHVCGSARGANERIQQTDRAAALTSKFSGRSTHTEKIRHALWSRTRTSRGSAERTNQLCESAISTNQSSRPLGSNQNLSGFNRAHRPTMQERDYERRTLARCCRRVSSLGSRLAVTIRPARTRRHRIGQLTRSAVLSRHRKSTDAHEALSSRTAHKKHTCTRHQQRPRDVRRVRPSRTPLPLSAAMRMRRSSPRHAARVCVACRRSSSSCSSVVREVREPCAGRTSGVGASPLPQGAPVAIRDLESDIESLNQLFVGVGQKPARNAEGPPGVPGWPFIAIAK